MSTVSQLPVVTNVPEVVHANDKLLVLVNLLSVIRDIFMLGSDLHI